VLLLLALLVVRLPWQSLLLLDSIVAAGSAAGGAATRALVVAAAGRATRALAVAVGAVTAARAHGIPALLLALLLVR
jgi:hypothetical protein